MADESTAAAPTSVQLIAWATELLTAADVPSPRYDAEELLAHLAGVPRLRLGLGVDLTAERRDRYRALVERRATREPLQHLLGAAAFRTVELAVGPGVFVPRPETEVVAGWAIDRLLARPPGPPPVVVDLCTGSGAIALAVATEVPGAEVYAVELDPDAAVWAERNLAGSGVRLEVGDATTAYPELAGTVDAITVNPPYIPLDAYESVAAEARDHDPALALWSGRDGLTAIRRIAESAARLLKPGGFCVCEHADVQGESAPAAFVGSGHWRRVRDHVDLAGRPRFVSAERR